MQAGGMRVVGAALEGGAVVAAALATDGVQLVPGEWARRELGAEATPEAVETAFAEVLARFAATDLIGILAPEGVSGALLAEVLGLPVVSDMASADQGMGGQGGPLGPFLLHALARHFGWGPTAVLDLGVLARLVWIDPAEAHPEAACLAFDAGPGLPQRMEPGGQVDDAMLHGFVQHPFFARRPPKWLTQGAFWPETGHLAPPDAAATQAAAVAAGVVLGLAHLPGLPERVVVTGPGRAEARLLSLIAAGCDLPVVAAEAAGLDPALLGAQTAAYLAARTLRGLPTTAPGTTGARASVSGGVISRPGATGLGR